MKINRQLFDLCVENFVDGNNSVDYTYRNVVIGDDEQSRLKEYYDSVSRKEWQSCFSPPIPLDELNKLEFEIMRGDDIDLEVVANLLRPYISNRRLAELSFVLWEGLFFTAQENQPWEVFKEDEIYSEYIKEEG